MAKTVLVLIVLVMFSIGLFIVSKVGVFLKESKKEASDEREGVQLVKILEGIPGERTKVNMNIQDSAWTKRQKNHHPIYIEKPSIKDYLLTFSIFSWLSGDIFNNVDIFSAYRNSCCQIKRSCPVI